MNNRPVLYWIVFFIISILITWIAFSLIVMWANPAFNNADGSVNWWTTLWVIAVSILFAWLIGLILVLIFRAFSNMGCKPKCAPQCAPAPCPVPCPPQPQCPPPCPPKDPCDPCASGKSDFMGMKQSFFL